MHVLLITLQCTDSVDLSWTDAAECLAHIDAGLWLFRSITAGKKGNQSHYEQLRHDAVGRSEQLTLWPKSSVHQTEGVVHSSNTQGLWLDCYKASLRNIIHAFCAKRRWKVKKKL